MATYKWVTKKPSLNKECLLITAINYGKEQGWAYHVWTVEKQDCDGKWYYALLENGEDEWGDIDDLCADKYAVLPLIKNQSKNKN